MFTPQVWDVAMIIPTQQYQKHSLKGNSEMKRLLYLPLLAITLFSVSCESASAKGFTRIKGSISYIHGEPTFVGVCQDPVPGVELAVAGDYIVDVNGTALVGSGPATTCVFDIPVFGIFAQYTGSFTWQSESGQTLRGDYVGFDINPKILVDPSLPFVQFDTVIYVTFTDAAGDFAGFATAKGIDVPFSDPTTNPVTPPGVYADFRGFLFGNID